MSALILIIIGVILMIIELALMNFIFIFFGLGFLLTGILSFFIIFGWEIQVLIAFILSLVLLFALKRPLKEAFNKSNDKINEDFLNETGIGVIKDDMVYFKGTFWQSDAISGLKNGDKVKVLGVKNNKIIIKRQDG